MKRKITLRSLMTVLFITAIGSFISPFLGLGLFGASFVQKPEGATFMAITVEIWERDIEENIFKDNEFLNYAVNADQYVLAGKVVHIPNAGGAPAVVKNRTDLPAQIVKRTDVDVTYPLDEYTSDPIKIENAENYELSYDKRQSVLADSQGAINETIGDWVLRAWAPTTAARMLRTTGAAILAHLDGATGNRKKFLTTDLKLAQKKLNKDGVPKNDRYALFSADMLDQLTDSLTETQYRDFSAAFDAQNGIIGKLYGFNILSRGSVLTYTNAALPVVKDPGADAAATDNDAVLCWQKQAVERAKGQIKFFEDIGNPTQYGDIYSALVRMGGRIRREDSKGICVIIQDSSN
jgi:P22 coat protein - gene protein 5.